MLMVEGPDFPQFYPWYAIMIKTMKKRLTYLGKIPYEMLLGKHFITVAVKPKC